MGKYNLNKKMKFFGTVALIQVVSAACGKDDAGAVVETCAMPDNQCLKLEIATIDAAVYKEGVDGYDADLKVGKATYSCTPAADVDVLLSASGVAVNGLSTTITKVEDDSAGSSAIMMKGAIAAAALGLVAYM